LNIRIGSCVSHGHSKQHDTTQKDPYEPHHKTLFFNPVKENQPPAQLICQSLMSDHQLINATRRGPFFEFSLLNQVAPHGLVI